MFRLVTVGCAARLARPNWNAILTIEEISDVHPEKPGNPAQRPPAGVAEPGRLRTRRNNRAQPHHRAGPGAEHLYVRGPLYAGPHGRARELRPALPDRAAALRRGRWPGRRFREP